MSFFSLLRDNHFDWEKTKEIFYNMTDLQIAWVNACSRLEKERMEKEREKHARNSKFGGGKTVHKSFDLKGE